MLLNEGDKILALHRRLFDKDEVHFFIGLVEAYEGGIAKATGHSFVRDIMRGKMIEKSGERTKFLSLSSGTLLVYLLPAAVKLQDLEFVSDEGNLSLTDRKAFTMSLAEHPHSGRA